MATNEQRVSTRVLKTVYRYFVTEPPEILSLWEYLDHMGNLGWALVSRTSNELIFMRLDAIDGVTCTIDDEPAASVGVA